MATIPFNDLRTQYLAHQQEFNAAALRVLDSGWYILGKETAAFEAEFATYLGAAGCAGVNSGTDAIHLALRALGVGPGDEVITVAHTAVATVAAIRMAGATPVLVDIDPVTYTMSPAALEEAINPMTRAVIPVHLYGHPADLAAIEAVVRPRGIWLIEDCAQAHGASIDGRKVGTFGDLACFSFYPTKNLGALGDGGAVTGMDPDLIGKVRLLREYGWSAKARYVSQVEGVNSRLDELQAALLRVKLKHLDTDNDLRRELAAYYGALLPEQVVKPTERLHCRHVYHLYVVRVPERDRVRAALEAEGVGTAIHYPVPIHRQPAYEDNRAITTHRLTQTELAANEIVSLPLYPGLTEAGVKTVAAALERALAA
ncbi:MAG: DegT/DnrJ/EryC1/StrS family aminotransferase [Anaerolineales bacterium]|nr:DegT/DnrJ/EryC1/StrS family aminotransferase [Anaerolineales bacterium]